MTLTFRYEPPWGLSWTPGSSPSHLPPPLWPVQTQGPNHPMRAETGPLVILHAGERPQLGVPRGGPETPCPRRPLVPTSTPRRTVPPGTRLSFPCGWTRLRRGEPDQVSTSTQTRRSQPSSSQPSSVYCRSGPCFSSSGSRGATYSWTCSSTPTPGPRPDPTDPQAESVVGGRGWGSTASTPRTRATDTHVTAHCSG